MRYYKIFYEKENKDYSIDRIVIKNKTHIKKFAKIVGFLHPEKKKKLRELLLATKGKKEKHFDTRKEILDLLECGKLYTNEISKILNRENSTIIEHLKKLEQAGKVKKDIEFFNRWGVCKKLKYKRQLWSLV